MKVTINDKAGGGMEVLPKYGKIFYLSMKF